MRDAWGLGQLVAFDAWKECCHGLRRRSWLVWSDEELELHARELQPWPGSVDDLLPRRPREDAPSAAPSSWRIASGWPRRHRQSTRRAPYRRSRASREDLRRRDRRCKQSLESYWWPERVAGARRGMHRRHPDRTRWRKRTCGGECRAASWLEWVVERTGWREASTQRSFHSM